VISLDEIFTVAVMWVIIAFIGGMVIGRFIRYGADDSES
jgi:uncharacterized protein YneF (UPF0154 family)